MGDQRIVPDLDRLVVLAAQPGWAWAPGERYTQRGDGARPDSRLLLGRLVDGATPREGSRCGPRSRSSGWSPPATVTRSPRPSAARPTGCPGSARPPTTAVTSSPRSRAQGVAVEQCHPEYAPGQFELSVAAESPVHAADTSVLVRQTIRSVGRRHGFRTSYSPKVDTAGVGNGGHVHLSLWRDGREPDGRGHVGLRAHRRGGERSPAGCSLTSGAAGDRGARRGVVPPAGAAALGRRLPLLGAGEPRGRAADGHRARPAARTGRRTSR